MSPKQKRFVDEYLIDLNATQAARRAGYSERTANEQGARLLANASVSKAIGIAQGKRSDRTAVTADRVVDELASMAFYDVGLIASAGVKAPEDIAKLPANLRRAIMGWNWDKAGNFTLKLAPKSTSLDMLARHLGMFREQLDLNVKGDLASMMAERRARAAERRQQMTASDAGES